MLFDILYIADWADIGKRKQEQVDKSDMLQKKHRLDWDHKIGDKVLIVENGIICKVEDPNKIPYLHYYSSAYNNVKVRIQRGASFERLHIRRLHPHFEG